MNNESTIARRHFLRDCGAMGRTMLSGRFECVSGNNPVLHNSRRAVRQESSQAVSRLSQNRPPLQPRTVRIRLHAATLTRIFHTLRVVVCSAGFQPQPSWHLPATRR